MKTTANTAGRTRRRTNVAASDRRIDVVARSNSATIMITEFADRRSSVAAGLVEQFAKELGVPVRRPSAIG